MELTREQENMLAGKEGKGYQAAMEMLVKLGEFYDAKRMVPIKMAFLTLGPSPSKPAQAVKWLEYLADEGARCKCPLALEPIDAANPATIALQKKLGGAFGIGSSGHPRNLFTKPIFGQHLIADGTAITHYCNSYIGARANTECFLGQYSAAICGCTPEYGFRLDENRKGKTLFEVKTKIKNETDWSALGFYISYMLAKHYWDVPVITGLDTNNITDDALVAFSSNIPAYGAVVHSLMVGVSPEARTVEEAFGGNKPIEKYVITDKELNFAYDRFSAHKKDVPDMVSFGGFGANVSIYTLNYMAKIFEGKKVSSKFPTVAMVEGAVRQVADKSGITEILQKAGVMIGMGEYLKDKGLSASDFSNNPVSGAKKMGLQTIVFIDAKSCHYIGNQEIDAVLRNVEDACQIALTGKMEVR